MPSYIFIEVGDDGKKVFNSFESFPALFSWLKETYKEVESSSQVLVQHGDHTIPLQEIENHSNEQNKKIDSELEEKYFKNLEVKKEDNLNVSMTDVYENGVLSPGVLALVDNYERDILPDYNLSNAYGNYKQKLNLTPEDCKEFLTWFSNTFCDDSSSNSNDKLQCIIRLVLDVPEFCFTSPLMTSEKISMPEKFKNYSPDIIIHHLNTLYGTDLRKRCEQINFSKYFLLFDKLSNLFSSKDSNGIISKNIIPVYGIWLTIHDFATKNLTKRTVEQWSNPFISLNYRKISSGATSTDIIKSSEMYKEYREFIDTIAKVFNCEETRKKMLATANTRFFAQEMKRCELNTVRKSEGIFFKDLQKKVFKTDETGTYDKGKYDEFISANVEGFSFDEDAGDKYESV